MSEAPTPLPENAEAMAALLGLEPGTPAYRVAALPHWTCRAWDRDSRLYTVAAVVCTPAEALAVLHPNHVPGQSIVVPTVIPAYRQRAWAWAWSVPIGTIVEFQIDRLPVRDGLWSDRS